MYALYSPGTVLAKELDRHELDVGTEHISEYQPPGKSAGASCDCLIQPFFTFPSPSSSSPHIPLHRFSSWATNSLDWVAMLPISLARMVKTRRYADYPSPGHDYRLEALMDASSDFAVPPDQPVTYNLFRKTSPNTSHLHSRRLELADESASKPVPTPLRSCLRSTRLHAASYGTSGCSECMTISCSKKNM